MFLNIFVVQEINSDGGEPGTKLHLWEENIHRHSKLGGGIAGWLNVLRTAVLIIIL